MKPITDTRWLSDVSIIDLIILSENTVAQRNIMINDTSNSI